jgi:hypothetical protein
MNSEFSLWPTDTTDWAALLSDDLDDLETDQEEE